MTDTPSSAALLRGRSVRRGAGARTFILLLPALAGTIVLGILPVATSVVLALTDSTLARPFADWVGTRNFSAVLEDPDFMDATLRGAVYAPVTAACSVLLGLGTALLIQHSSWTGPIGRSLLILPMLIPPVVVGNIWKLVFSPNSGLLDTVLTAVGFDPVALLSSPLAITGIAVADVWEWTPLCTLLILAALLSVDEATIEAARLDGAHGVSLFRHITLPSIAPALLGVFAIRLILGLKLFDLVATMTTGGPGLSTASPSYLIWRSAFHNFDLGGAAAASVVLAITCAVLIAPVAVLIRKAHQK